MVMASLVELPAAMTVIVCKRTKAMVNKNVRSFCFTIFPSLFDFAFIYAESGVYQQ